MGIFSDHANDYYERNFLVMPLSGKRPFIPDWQNPETLNKNEKLIEDFPDSNIGLLLGKESGVVALDWDGEIDNLAEFIAMISEFIPTNAPKKIGKKGITIFYKWQEGLQNKSLLGVFDFLAERKQTVLPPSIHPETKQPYRWEGPSLIEWHDQGYEMPVIELKDIKKLEIFFGHLKKNTTKAGDHQANEGRNQKLYQMACAALEKNKSIDEVAQEIEDADLIHHRGHPNGPYFKDKQDAWATPGGALKFATTVFNNLKRRGKLQDWTGEYTSTLTAGANAAILNYEKKRLPPETEEIEMDSNMAFLPPFITNLANYLGQGTIAKNGSVLAALSFMSGYLGQRICYGDIFGKRTMANIYTMHIMYSGGGKSLLMQSINLLKMNNPELFTGFSDTGGPKSDAAIYKILSSKPVVQMVIDEFHEILSAKANGNKNFMGLNETLSIVYSQSSSKLAGRIAANEQYSANDVNYPYLVLHGGTQPINFIKKIVGSKDFGEIFYQGLGGRILYGYDPDIKIPKISNTAVFTFSTIGIMLKEMQNYMGNLGQMRGEYKDIAVDEGVNQHIFDLKDNYDELRRNESESSDELSIYSSMIARKTENIIKIGLIYAVSESIFRNKLILTIDDLTRAKRTVEHFFENIRHLIDHSSDKNSNHESSVAKIAENFIKKLAQNADRGLTRKEIYQFCNISKDDFEKIRQPLIKAKKIKMKKFKSANNRIVERFFICA